MRNQILQKEELDQIGRKLLETARVSNEEIERIVAAPQLFDSVKARIQTDQRERKSNSFAGNSWSSIFWSWQRISVAATVLMLFAFGVLGFVLSNKTLQIDEQAAIVTAIQTPDEPVEIQPIPEVFTETAETKNPEIKPQFIAKKENSKKESFIKPKAERKTPSTVKKSSQPKIELASEFYALNYVGNPNEAGENLRIVRTELSPSALFSLGVNVPIENVNEKIKTDLLVGSDGVARAIRFVE